jgi:threonine dehydratase
VKLNWQGGDKNIQIYLKLENLQPIGSFKVRPAANAIACIKDKKTLKKVGVCTSSAGNFGQGLVWCASE